MSELAKHLNDSIVNKDLVSVRSMLITNPDLYKHVEIRNKRYLEDNNIGNPREISPPSPHSRRRTSSKSGNSMVELAKQLNAAIVNQDLDSVSLMLRTNPDLYKHVEIRNKRYLEDNRIGNPKEISPPSPPSRRRGKRGGSVVARHQSAMHRSAMHKSKTYKNKNNTKRRR